MKYTLTIKKTDGFWMYTAQVVDADNRQVAERKFDWLSRAKLWVILWKPRKPYLYKKEKEL